MTPAEFRAIRQGAGLSARLMAQALQISDGRAIRRYESGETGVSGPISILMGMLRDGTWRP